MSLLPVSVRSIVPCCVSRPRITTWLRRTFAGAFVALGVRLAVAER